MYPSRLLPDTPEATILPYGLTPAPYGEIPYLELIEYYARQALAKRSAGLEWFALRGMPGLHEARAATLGARSVGLPVYVSLQIEPGWDGEKTGELLAALICLQELGIAGFGLDFGSVTGELLELYAALFPYAKAPLTARPAYAAPAEQVSLLARAGVAVLFGDRDHLAREEIAHAAAAGFPLAKPSRQEDAPLLLCGETEVYYLEEDFTLSPPIKCTYDMSSAILEAEDEGFDAICFHVESSDDAMNLGRNFHMVRQAACILAESPEALELALALYSGRVLIDARSDVEEARLTELAAAYGAIIR